VQAAQESISAADADYELAAATMNRYQTLYDKKSLSPQEYDEVKTRLAASQARRDAAHAGKTQAEAGVVQASTAMGFTRVRAPFDGVVISKVAEPGAMAAPGVPLLVVEDPSRFRLEVQVDESKLSAVKMGESVRVAVDSVGDRILEGKVTQIVPAADPASRTITVKIDLPASSQIRSGLFGRAYFSRGEREAIQVPRSAILSRGQLQAVYVVGTDRLAGLRFVTLGKALGDQVEVLSGLQSGDRIVTQPGDRELSGRQVEAQ
jgi:RND family efflux transporter MFP subunit